MKKKTKKQRKKLTQRKKARYLFLGALIFFSVFVFILISTAFLTFYKELGIQNYVIIGSIVGAVLTTYIWWWLVITKRRFLLGI